MAATTDAKKDTKNLIMDAAEVMMAEHGINGVSNRAILADAGANTAALHYHFNSREGLIEAMVARHGRFVTLRRKEIISEFQARNVPPKPEDIVDLIVDPMIDLLKEKGEDGRRFLRFVARLQSDRTGIHRSEEEKYFPEVREELTHMLRDACPEIPRPVLELRMTMILDTMLQSLANADVMTQAWEDDRHEEDLNEFAAALKTFLAGGLAAAVT